MNEMQIQELTTFYSTPMYVLDVGALLRRVRFLRRSLPEKIFLCYAVKANPFLLRELAEEVDRFEACSMGELQICRKMRIPEKKLVISGVCKPLRLVSRGAFPEKGAVGVYTVESVNQFEMFRAAARERERTIPLLLRLTSGNQFGMDGEMIRAILQRYGKEPFLDIRGIQYFSGTQKRSPERLERELAGLDRFLEELRQECGYRAEELEYGPGFPVKYFQEESGWKEEEFLKKFSALLQGMKFGGRITLELGRSIAASCGSYLTKVADAKTNQGRNYAIVDGGIHHLTYYGAFMGMKQPKCRLYPARRSEDDMQNWTVCGSLCTVNDILIRRYPAAGLCEGDILEFQNAGAYCMTEGISLFLSRELPRVILINKKGGFQSIRDHVRTDILNTPYYEEV